MENEEKDAGSSSPHPAVEEVKQEVKVEVVAENVASEGPDWSKLGPELQAKLDALTGDFDAYKASVSLGVTDWDHFEVVKWQWQKTSKETSISSWLDDMISGKTPIPKIIAPFISPAPSTPTKVQAELVTPKIVPASTVAGQNISTKISSQVLAEARRKASLGDASELRALLGRELKKK